MKDDTLNPFEKAKAYSFALWLAVVACGSFTTYVFYIDHRLSVVNDYLLSHPTQTTQATVTRVFSKARWFSKHPWCAIYIEASFKDLQTGRIVSLAGPDHYGLVGTRIQWAECDDRGGPIDYGRSLVVGDRLPVIYSVANPSMNRPGWLDYSTQLRRGRPVRAIALGLTVLLLLVTFVHRRIARAKLAARF